MLLVSAGGGEVYVMKQSNDSIRLKVIMLT